jgi:hypothetical protein
MFLVLNKIFRSSDFLMKKTHNFPASGVGKTISAQMVQTYPNAFLVPPYRTQKVGLLER